MATRSIPQPPIPASHVFLSLSSSLPRRHSGNIRMTMMMMKLAAIATSVATHNKLKPIRLRFGESLCLWLSPCSPRFSFVKAAPENSSNLAAADDYRTVAQIKQDLFAALQGIDRGIFGVPSEKKSQIHSLVELLESHNSTPQPTLCLEKVAGAWKLIYSTITILGSRRTKLGLRDFITLGDFFQSINVAEGKAVNVIKFSAKGLNLLSGQLTIDASFKIASKSRVDINYNKSVITPTQLMNVFRKNYDLLLQIFNPEGWLEITYVDDSLRIGRDDKGNIFILERLEDYNPERFC